MKLLILTQKVDQHDAVLGFMHGWIAEFAKHCDRVTVIALEVGAYDLPPHVQVFSLGKQYGAPASGFFDRLTYVANFYRLIFRERKHYDAVFVHMNSEYVLLGGIPWRLLGKRVGLWYAHGHVPLALRLALALSSIVFTSTTSGFRIVSPKVAVTGQGIDTLRFAYTPRSHKKGEAFRLIMVGRISPVKDYATLLRAVHLLNVGQIPIALDIVGGAGTREQEAYVEDLKQLVQELDIADEVSFHGAVANDQIATLLERAHCFVNTSKTGSFDKAVGEAMAAGLPVLTCNEAFIEVLGKYHERLMFSKGDATMLAKKISEIITQSDNERNALGQSLRTLIEKHHGLPQFVEKIITLFTK